MSEIITKKVVELEKLGLYHDLEKAYVDAGLAKKWESATFNEATRKVSFYTVPQPSGETAPVFEFTLPEVDFTEVMETIQAETNRAKDAEEANAKAIADEKTRAEEAESVLTQAVADINNVDTGILAQSKAYSDSKVKDLADGAVADNTAAIATLNGDENTAGSVKKAVVDLKATLDTDIAAAKKAGDDAQADVDSLETKVGDISTLITTEKSTVVGAINEVKGAVDSAKTAGEVTVTTDSTTEGYLKTYTIKQGGVEISKIDIPKDLVVTSGEIVVDPEGQPAGTYIKLTIANQETPIYINVKSLVDVYTAEQSATQIQLVISDTNEISATIVAGSVGTTELTDGAITTVKIADANVTLAKLASDVTEAIADAKKAGTDASAAVTALAEGQVATNTANIAKAQADATSALEQIAAIQYATEDDIRALFA